MKGVVKDFSLRAIEICCPSVHHTDLDGPASGGLSLFHMSRKGGKQQTMAKSPRLETVIFGGAETQVTRHSVNLYKLEGLLTTSFSDTLLGLIKCRGCADL